MPLFTVNLIYLLSVTSTQDSQVAKNDTKKRFYGAMFASLACNNRIFVRINFHEKNLWRDDIEGWGNDRVGMWVFLRWLQNSSELYSTLSHEKHANPAAYITTLRFALPPQEKLSPMSQKGVWRKGF